MDCAGCSSSKPDHFRDLRWRRALWIALAVNDGMFAAEMAAGFAGGSKALQADALDFLGDAANYAISLGVVGMALAWRARAALLQGATLAALGVYVLAATLWAVWHGGTPRPEITGVVGVVALVSNAGVALMLYRFRTGDANMRSVWICSRNDEIGNVAVVLAAAGVFQTGTARPTLSSRPSWRGWTCGAARRLSRRRGVN